MNIRNNFPTRPTLILHNEFEHCVLNWLVFVIFAAYRIRVSFQEIRAKTDGGRTAMLILAATNNSEHIELLNNNKSIKNQH